MKRGVVLLLAALVTGLPVAWAAYSLFEDAQPVEIRSHISKSNAYLLGPTGLSGRSNLPAWVPEDSFDFLLLQADRSQNKRLFRLLKGFHPIKLNRPQGGIVRVPGDLPVLAKSANSTAEGIKEFWYKPKEDRNEELMKLLKEFSDSEIILRGHFGEAGHVVVPGDIDTPLDWNARTDQKVWVSNGGAHATLTYDQLQELARRKKALVAAGVVEAALPSREALAEAQRQEASFPPHVRLERSTPVWRVGGTVHSWYQPSFIAALPTLPAGSIVAAYEVTGGHGRPLECHIEGQLNGATISGWVEAAAVQPLEPGGGAPVDACGLPIMARRAAAEIVLPQTWISDGDRRTLEARRAKIGEARSNPTDTLRASLVQLCGWYAWPYSLAWIAWFIADFKKTLALGLPRAQRGPEPQTHIKAEYGVPHCRFEETPEGFKVACINLPAVGGSVGLLLATVIAMLVLILLGWWLVDGVVGLAGGLTVGIVGAAVGVAALYFSARRPPTQVEVTRETVIIDATRLKRSDFGTFHVRAAGRLAVLGYSYGLRNFTFGGLWQADRASEFTSALNVLLRHSTADVSPEQLRSVRPTDF